MAEYAGISFDAALDLPVDMYKNFLRNFIIDKLNESEKGRKKLNLWRRTQITTMDTSNLDFFQKL